MKQRPCTYCGTTFTQPAKRGRPVQFCSDTCRKAARTDYNRKCVVCGDQFLLTKNHQWIQYCGQTCANVDKFNANCHVCKSPTNSGLYCSAECQRKAYKTIKKCAVCGTEIKPSQTPPWNHLPDVHPACVKGPDIRTAEDFRFVKALLSHQLPLNFIPLAPGRRLWKPLAQQTLDLLNTDNFTSKPLNSVAWWRYAIPKWFDELQPGVATAALCVVAVSGLGGQHTPRGALPLRACWPWVHKIVSEYGDVRRVKSAIAGYTVFETPPEYLDRKRMDIMRKIEHPETAKAAWKPQATGVPMIYYEIKKVNAQGMPPDPTTYIDCTPKQLKEAQEFMADLNDKYRNYHKRAKPSWAVVPYPTTKPIPDQWDAMTIPILARYGPNDPFR